MNQSRNGTLDCITARSGAFVCDENAAVALPPNPGSGAMPEYRIYLVGPDGHFIQSEPILCADDAAAIETAEQLIIYGRDVELWQGDRKITKLIASPRMEQAQRMTKEQDAPLTKERLEKLISDLEEPLRPPQLRPLS